MRHVKLADSPIADDKIGAGTGRDEDDLRRSNGADYHDRDREPS